MKSETRLHIDQIDTITVSRYEQGIHIEAKRKDKTVLRIYCGLSRTWTYQDEVLKMTAKETGAEAPVMLKNQAD